MTKIPLYTITLIIAINSKHPLQITEVRYIQKQSILVMKCFYFIMQSASLKYLWDPTLTASSFMVVTRQLILKFKDYVYTNLAPIYT